MQVYTEMVNSAVTWIGKIPANWQVKKFSSLYTATNAGEVIPKEYWDVDGPLLMYTASQSPIRSIFPSFPSSKRTKLDDILIARNGDGVIHQPEENSIYTNVVQRVSFARSDVCIRYVIYALKASLDYVHGQSNGDFIVSLNMGMWNNTRLPVPHRETQQKIADFLDTETAQIDNLIAKQERLLELLEEKRRATITHAVTRGLNPGVELKETNIPWLGQVPVHWDLYRAKYLFEKIQEKPLDTDKVVTAFRDGEVVLRSLRREDGFTFADKEIGYQHVSVGDLVIHAMDAFAGAVGVSKSEGKMSPVCSICRPIRSGVDTEYYAQLVRAMTSTNYLVAIAKGIRERSTDFRFGDFSNMTFPLPPLDEQRGIISRINDENEKVAKLKQKVQTQITLLRERRTSLISHAVTGKVKV